MVMSFGFSEEQELYRAQLRRFGQERIAPRRQEWDRDRKSPGPVLEFYQLGRSRSVHRDLQNGRGSQWCRITE